MYSGRTTRLSFYNYSWKMDPTLPTLYDQNTGLTVLHHACASGRKDVVQVLLDHGGTSILFQNIDNDTTRKMNTSPLGMGLQNGHLEMVNELMEDLADKYPDRVPTTWLAALSIWRTTCTLEELNETAIRVDWRRLVWVSILLLVVSMIHKLAWDQQ